MKRMQEGGPVDSYYDRVNQDYAQPSLKNPRRVWSQDRQRNWGLYDLDDPQHVGRFIPARTREDMEAANRQIMGEVLGRHAGGVIHATHPFALGYRRVA